MDNTDQAETGPVAALDSSAVEEAVSPAAIEPVEDLPLANVLIFFIPLNPKN